MNAKENYKQAYRNVRCASSKHPNAKTTQLIGTAKTSSREFVHLAWVSHDAYSGGKKQKETHIRKQLFHSIIG